MFLNNKKAIVTGGSSGIGQAIAIAYAKEGANLVISYEKNQEGAEKTCKEIQALGRKCHAVKVNFADQYALKAFVHKALDFLGGVDILVNNAGTLSRCNDFLSISIDELDFIHHINFRAPFILTQLIAEQMKIQGNGGSIINVSSISTRLYAPGFAHYECSKAALNKLTEASAGELAEYQIRVNAISPGLIATNINADQREKNPALWTRRTSKIPLKRSGLPSDLIPWAILLASDQTAWTTGANIHVDGGMSVAS